MTEFNKGFDEAGVEIIHHFGRNFYVKQVNFSKDKVLSQHKHKFDHLSWLSTGSVLLKADGKESLISGPKMIEIPAGVEHEVRSLTDVVWLCMHATSETDVEKIDESLV